MGGARPHDVHDSEMFALFYYDVGGIFITWKDKGSLSFDEEVDLIQTLVFLVNVLAFLVELWFHERTHPKDELGASLLKEMNPVIPLLVHIER